MRKTLLVALLAAAPLLQAAPTPEQLEQRLKRVEQVIGGKALVDMQLRMQQLQEEVQQLRGELEALNHEIRELKSHQRDLYQDLDRRLLALERGGVNRAAEQGAGEEEGQLPSQEEQGAYQQGIDLLQEFRYAQAAQAFASYLKAYPQGRYAPIARYWLADAYYSDRDYKQAIAHYQQLLKEYPDHSKAVQAMLKIGYSQAELKQWKEARESMEAVVAQHPKTTEANLARKYLQRLKQQGH